MPMGKGTYGSKRGRPSMKKKTGGSKLTAGQKKLRMTSQKNIMAKRKK